MNIVRPTHTELNANILYLIVSVRSPALMSNKSFIMLENFHTKQISTETTMHHCVCTTQSRRFISSHVESVCKIACIYNLDVSSH